MKQLLVWLGLLCGLSAYSSELSQRIDSLLKASRVFSTSHVGVRIVQMGDKTQTVYEWNDRQLFRPASTAKVLTAAAALEVLGRDYMLKTRIAYDGEVVNDTLQGNLYLIGDLDSELSLSELYQLAKDALKRMPIGYIKGNIIGVSNLMEDTHFGPGWCWDDAETSFQPYISALLVNKGCVDINFRPCRKGQPAYIELLPLLPRLYVDNQTQTRTGTSNQLSMRWSKGIDLPQTLYVAGLISRDESVSMAIIDSKQLTLASLMDVLRSLGVGFSSDSLCFAPLPSSATELAVKKRPITELVLPALKNSDNLSAESLFLQMGHKLSHPEPTSFQWGARRLSMYLQRKIDARADDFRIADGSGLSLYNYVSPYILTQILGRIYRHPELYPIFKSSLPQAGVDGTLSRRMLGTKAEGRVFAKTGTVTGVSSLAGYVEKADGTCYVFAVLVNGVLKASDARKLQDDICALLAE